MMSVTWFLAIAATLLLLMEQTNPVKVAIAWQTAIELAKTFIVLTDSVQGRQMGYDAEGARVLAKGNDQTFASGTPAAAHSFYQRQAGACL